MTKQPTSDEILEQLTAAMKQIQEVFGPLEQKDYAVVVRIVADVYEKAWRRGAEFADSVWGSRKVKS